MHEARPARRMRASPAAARSWSPISGSTTGAGGSEALGRAEDDDDVDVEAGRAGQRADVDAVADLAVAAGRDVELGDERGPELGAGDRAADAVEVVQPVEHAPRLSPTPTARRRPVGRGRRARTSAPGGPSPTRPTLAHGRTCAGSPRSARSSVTNASSSAGRRRLGRRVPAIGGQHARRRSGSGGWPSRRRARRRRHARCAPTGRSGRRGRRRDGPARRRAASSGRCGAGPRRSSSSSSARTRGTIRSPTVVPGRPFHGMPAACELVLDEAGVRPVGREQDGDAVEPRAGRGRRRPRRARRCAPRRRRRSWTRRRRRPVGATSAGRPRTGTGSPASASARAATAASASASPVSPTTSSTCAPLGRARTAAAARAGAVAAGGGRRAAASRPGRSTVARSAARASRSPSSYHSWAQQPGDLGGDAGRLVTAGRAGQRGERPGPGDAQLAVQVAQGDDGRGVVVDAGVEARRVVR